MKKRERKLTPAELKRKELFEADARELIQRGYERKDLTINVFMINILAPIIMLPVIVLFCWLYLTINGQSITFSFNAATAIIFLVSAFGLVVIHEGIHGMTWLFAKEHFRAIEFGMIWRMLTPYCTCKCALKRWQYILGAMMPTIVVGILPAVIALARNDSMLFLLSLIMIIGGGGDVMIILKMLLYKTDGKDSVFIDHPYECGMVVFKQKV